MKIQNSEFGAQVCCLSPWSAATGSIPDSSGSKLAETSHLSPWSVATGSRPHILAFAFVILLTAVSAFAAPKSASAYYSDAAFQYIENRLPSAEITCNEGLQYYPNDQKLQMLLDRIHEAKDEQKNENKKNDKNQDNNQDQNQDQNKDQQDQNKDQQNRDQNGEGNSSGSESSSSASEDQNGGGQSSSSDAGSSDSEGGAQPEQQPEQPQENSSDSNGGEEPQEQPVQMGEMSPEEAAQLLKDFDEQNGERKPWKPIRGQARPAKDW
ncbi:hypothetical protein [Fibrobacter sp.]|uniref:hypothetical protein n=1 Tax=Fibrobacter sp. TaxID=35828 RepID=UPI0025C4835B|nr:hypothetical protein [Fibrobacter sp.]MCI6438172.1 hypothetical protein [Fibrobacter sp.]